MKHTSSPKLTIVKNNFKPNIPTDFETHFDNLIHDYILDEFDCVIRKVALMFYDLGLNDSKERFNNNETIN